MSYTNDELCIPSRVCRWCARYVAQGQLRGLCGKTLKTVKPALRRGCFSPRAGVEFVSRALQK